MKVMSEKERSEVLQETIDKLSSTETFDGLSPDRYNVSPLPSESSLREIISLSRSILFPGYYGDSIISNKSMGYHIGVEIEKMNRLLTNQVFAGLCFHQDDASIVCQETALRAADIAVKVTGRLPDIRKVLATDVHAAYNGDPAATSYGEIIACYPVIKALTCYRLAHELFKLDVPLIPRIITELAHSETGIDIHPAAQIGNYFTIDHGTGVVIGATCIIGNNVKLYQGVTLGARSFPLDENGNPIKGIPRHPILEDNVIVYSNATILGRITIGHDAVIGANMWITSDVEPAMKVFKR